MTEDVETDELTVALRDTMRGPSSREVLAAACFVETVTERGPDGQVMASEIRPATPEDIAMAILQHEAGQCPHNVVQDQAGWLYDLRSCAICGAGLGTV